MSGVNKFVAVGNLTRDAELKYTANQKAVSGFGIAINEGSKTTFLEVNLWGKVAESVNQYLTKGKQVYVEGRIEVNEWEKDGVKRSRPVVNAFQVQLLGGKQVENNVENEVQW